MLHYCQVEGDVHVPLVDSVDLRAALHLLELRESPGSVYGLC